MRLVCVLVLVLGGFQLTCALIKVASWNVETFGEAKAKADKGERLKHIAEVVRQYDLVVIQEVRHVNAITALMSLLNAPPPPPNPPTAKKPRVRRGLTNIRTKGNPAPKRNQNIPLVGNTGIQKNPTPVRNNQGNKPIAGGQQGGTSQTKPVSSIVYAYKESGPLPTAGSHHERYVYIYKTSTVKFLGSYQYPESKGQFSRPPFAAQFNAVTESFDFVMIPLHAKPGPDITVHEINALANVVKALPRDWNKENILLLGDFNAGGTYLPQVDKDKLTLPANCKWLIGDNADTTVSKKSSNPYDRIVATDNMIRHHVVPGTAKPYDFKNGLGLTQNKAEKVSDHFPVEVKLKKKV